MVAEKALMLNFEMGAAYGWRDGPTCKHGKHITKKISVRPSKIVDLPPSNSYMNSRISYDFPYNMNILTEST